MINDKNEAIGRSENVCLTADFGHIPLKGVVPIEGSRSEVSLENAVFSRWDFWVPCEHSAAVAGLRIWLWFRCHCPLLFVCFFVLSLFGVNGVLVT